MKLSITGSGMNYLICFGIMSILNHSLFQYEPFVYRVESVNNTPLYSGYAFSVLDIIAEKFNFRYVLSHLHN